MRFFLVQIREMWLHRLTDNNESFWVGLNGIDEKKPKCHFKIQGNSGIVNIRTGANFNWKLVVIPSAEPKKPLDATVRFVPDNGEIHNSYIQEFLLDSEIGEGAFHLVVLMNGSRYHLRLNKTGKDDPFIVLEQHEPRRRAGLVGGDVDFTFCIGQKW